MAALQAKITDIPVKVFTDNVLSSCETKDVISLGCANKFFALVATDEKFWKRKLAIDYNFTGSETARTSGWKFLYQRLRNPRVFVWGYTTFSSSQDLFANGLMCAYWNHSERRTMVNLGYRGFQRRPLGMSLFQSNFTFQMFVSSAWQHVISQYRFHSYSQQTPSYATVSVY